MKNKQTMALIAFGIMALFGVGLVMAYQGDPTVQGPYYSEERHEAMELAFETLDYDAWVALMTEDGRHPRVVNVVTEENFKTFVQIHEAMRDGDIETARELRAELGLGQAKMNGVESLRDKSQMSFRGQKYN